MKNSIPKKALTLLMSFAMLLTLVSFDWSGNVFTTKAQAIDCLVAQDSFQFYIKNVRSGKYLTLEGDSSAVGTQIIQYGFTGGNNQKWVFEERQTGLFGGFYRIKSVKNLNRVISMENGSGNNGVLAKLANIADSTLQHFHITEYSDDTVRFFTNASNNNKVLEINGAYTVNGAKLIQYAQVTNGSDQFLIEPVDKMHPFGILYAQKQMNKRIMTYPNFNNYSGSDAIDYQQVNFVSQCICAGGNHYKNGTYLWNVNKNDFFQPSSFTMTDLNTHWSITSSWYDRADFWNQWKVITTTDEYTYSQIMNSSTINCNNGDVIIAGHYYGTTFSPSSVCYVYNIQSPVKNTVLYAHKICGADVVSTLNTLCSSFYNNNNSFRIQVIHTAI